MHCGKDVTKLGASAAWAGRSLRGLAPWVTLSLAAAITGCSGPQSALAPAGPVAARLADLFWGMTAGAFVILGVVVALGVYATYRRGPPHTKRVAHWLIVGGGVAFPSIVLLGLLTYGLVMLPEVLAPAPTGSLRIQVTGEQWWWRVRYLSPEGAPVELANEIRLPVNQPVEFELVSADVIHSFWIPALGGKMDMIPGRRTRLTLSASKLGTFRGACAEYCGGSHALMAFPVVVMEGQGFARWLDHQTRALVEPAGDVAARGLELFLASGCGACHAVRGTRADGVIGPDLTHVGSRLSLAAGTLPNDRAAFRRWLSHTTELKPEVHMPAFGMLREDELEALSGFLESLQ